SVLRIRIPVSRIPSAVISRRPSDYVRCGGSRASTRFEVFGSAELQQVIDFGGIRIFPTGSVWTSIGIEQMTGFVNPQRSTRGNVVVPRVSTSLKHHVGVAQRRQ